MTEEQLEKAKKIQDDLKLANEALEITTETCDMDLVFLKNGARYDMSMNKVFFKSIYPDLKLYIKTFCEIRLSMLIKAREKGLKEI